jgi:hypothetical protein
MGFLVGIARSRLTAGLGAAVFAMHAIAVLWTFTSSYSFWSSNGESLWRDLARGNLCTIAGVLVYLAFQVSAWRRIRSGFRGQ